MGRECNRKRIGVRVGEGREANGMEWVTDGRDGGAWDGRGIGKNCEDEREIEAPDNREKDGKGWKGIEKAYVGRSVEG